MVQRKCTGERLVALERGATLVETLIACAIALLVLAAITAYALGSKAYVIRSAVESVAALMADARSVAQTSGSGATIVIATTPSGGFTATLYPYRPIPSATVGAAAVRTLQGAASITPTAIFVDSSGTTASSSSWTPQSGTLSSEPPCTSATQLVFSNGYTSETHAVPCTLASLQ